MKKIISLALIVSILAMSAVAFASVDLASMTDEELVELSNAIIVEQEKRIREKLDQMYLVSEHFDDYFIGLKQITFQMDSNNNTIAVLTLDFSHTKWTKKTYGWNIIVEVFQDNYACEHNEEWSSDNHFDEIKADRVLEVQEAFTLVSDSPLVIQITPGVNLATGEIIFIYDQNISGMQTNPIPTATLVPEPQMTPTPTQIKESSSYQEFGEQLSMIVNSDGVCVLKYKIKPSWTNEKTISQNYFTVESFILDGGGDQYSEIQYWAVADMTDGTEAKVINFTLNESLIQAVKNRRLAAIEFGEYVDDLWILPSLLD